MDICNEISPRKQFSIEISASIHLKLHRLKFSIESMTKDIFEKFIMLMITCEEVFDLLNWSRFLTQEIYKIKTNDLN